MSKDEAVTQWITNLADGDQSAAGRIWDEYFDKLTRLARRKLEGTPLRELDEEDVALSAMNSFCMGIANHKFDALQNRTDLWKLLVTITARKASNKLRKHYAQKRGGGGIRGESVFIHSDGDDLDDGIGNILGTEPSPELAIGVAENCQKLLDMLDGDTQRKIALMTLEGYRTEEIAQELDCTKRTVERKLQRIREIWNDHDSVLSFIKE